MKSKTDKTDKADNTNPKDLLGIKKVQLGLFPAAGSILGAAVMTNGAEKYGAYNWRKKNVRLTVYLDAMERHLLAIRDGQDNDLESGLPHIGHILANAAIIADAQNNDNLIDDRPTVGPAASLLEYFRKTD